MSTLCIEALPFDFTACGGYAQGELRKSTRQASPVRAEPFGGAQDRLRVSEVEAQTKFLCTDSK
jgi:hypothetical protein